MTAIKTALALMPLLFATSAFASSYQCVSQAGEKIALNKVGTQPSFSIQQDNGTIFTCTMIRSNRQEKSNANDGGDFPDSCRYPYCYAPGLGI